MGKQSMSKEYHLIKEPNTEGYEQCFIISVERDKEEQELTLTEIFVITSIGDKEVKARLDIEHLFELVARREGGNIPPENYDKLYGLLNPVIPEQVQLLNQIDMFQKELEEGGAELLIRGAEAAESAHTTDFDSIIKEKLSKK